MTRPAAPPPPPEPVERLARAILHRVYVESAPTYNGQAARRVRAWITGIVEAERDRILKDGAEGTT